MMSSNSNIIITWWNGGLERAKAISNCSVMKGPSLDSFCGLWAYKARGFNQETVHNSILLFIVCPLFRISRSIPKN